MLGNIAVVVYVAGVLIGLAFMRDRWATRVATALVWPLGPMALLVVTVILLLAAAVLWPVRIIGSALIVAGLVWWLL